jgi:hypothetical protein
VASVGVETSRLQRPSIRAGLSARHPILYASFDDSWKTRRRRPHLYDGLLSQALNFPGSPPPAPRPRAPSGVRFSIQSSQLSHGERWDTTPPPQLKGDRTSRGMRHRQCAYPALSTAPSGKTPVSRKRHSAMSNLRDIATIPTRLKGCDQRSMVTLIPQLELAAASDAIAKTHPTSGWLAPPAAPTSG